MRTHIYKYTSNLSLSQINQMDNKQLDNWLGFEELLNGADQLDFSGFPQWRNWQLDFPALEEEIIDAIPLVGLYPSEPIFPQDLFEVEFDSMFNESEENNGLLDGLAMEKRDEIYTRKEQAMRERSSSSIEERNITFEDVSKYFYMPITQAAKELNVGLTLLKKKCRELGIPRWPHRKMKSLQALIKNVQELGRVEGEAGEVQLRTAIEVLEQERMLMEKKPAMQLEEKTKRLRQACFKANYKKRRLMAAATDERDLSPFNCSSGYFYTGVHDNSQ